jgi:ABC-type transport system involved in cytochrome bd biosynthesis fused ATPase/permease subunit
LFLRNPQLLIFDEPTAHLDAEAARETSHLIAELAKSRTLLLISHRPETLTLAKRILLLDGGRVIADALPDVLANTEPLFRSLALEGASLATSPGKPRRTVPEVNAVLS